MKVFRISLIFSLLFVLQACGPNQKDLNQKKRAEVMVMHDEVMPKLGQLKAFEKKALKMAGEYAAMDPVDSAQVKNLEELAVALNQAYEGMFDWMHQYETDDSGQSPEEVSAYLDEQLVLVVQVNKSIKDALAKSDSLLVD